MESWIRILSYINLAGAIHALIQALVLLFIRRGNRPANRIMAAFLLTLAVGMAHGMLSILDIYRAWPALSILMGAMILAYGPLFYLYIRAMTVPERRVTPLDLVHGFPFLAGALSYAFFLISQSDETAPAGLFGFAARSPWVVVLALSVLQAIGYVGAIIRLLRRHSERIRASYATIDRINLGWLRRRLGVFAAIWAIGLGLVAALGFEARTVALVGQIVYFLVALNVFATGYRAMFQPETFYGAADAKPGRRYERSSLTPEEATLHKERLLELMERDKPYLDAEITLPKLAQALDIPVAHLSQVLNDLCGRNFYEFINRYRVEAAMRRLERPEAGGEKLISVALECGFNSVATFNRVFKELAGRTPSEYRKSRALKG